MSQYPNWYLSQTSRPRGAEPPEIAGAALLINDQQDVLDRRAEYALPDAHLGASVCINEVTGRIENENSLGQTVNRSNCHIHLVSRPSAGSAVRGSRRRS